jgi:hypothetical protein
MDDRLLETLTDHMIEQRAQLDKHVWERSTEWVNHQSEWAIEFDRMLVSYAASCAVLERVEAGHFAVQTLTAQVEYNEKRAAMPWWRFW